MKQILQMFCLKQQMEKHMKKTIGSFLVLVVWALFFSSPAPAADCSGGWQVLPNYRPGSGGPCAAIGLDTNRGVCRPGQRYETLCDDASGGRYRVCQGPRPCYDDRDRRGRGDYYDRDRRGRGDYYDRDRRRFRPARDCRSWDYAYDRPCPRGYFNPDCRGGCVPY